MMENSMTKRCAHKTSNKSDYRLDTIYSLPKCIHQQISLKEMMGEEGKGKVVQCMLLKLQ